MQLVESGNLDTVVEIKSKDEFGQLGRSFNNMVISLKEAYAEINERQKELTFLNETLTESNNQTGKAYKELKQTQIQLVQHEKMASLGMLVAGIAHEINTPLGAVNCNIDLYKILINQLKNKPNIIEDEKSKNIVDKLEFANRTNIIASERIMNIVKSLKSFARLDEAQYQIADIHQGIDNTLVLLNSKLKNKIEVIKEYGQIPEIWCFPNQLNQVFMNLLVNGCDSIIHQGIIWIKTYTDENYAFVVIKDNGIGIKADVIDRIFDPGYTTKGVGVGTGLGLSIVYNIVEKHKGSISVKSQVGEGTEFIVQIPMNLGENEQDIQKS